MTRNVFKLTTKKIDESSKYIIAKGDGVKLPIAEYGWEKKWYRPEGSKSRLRSKIKKFWYIRWDTKNLTKIFGTEISVSTRYSAGGVSNSYSLIRHVPVAEWARELDDLAKGLKVNIRFE